MGIEDDSSSKPSVKEKIVTFYNKHKFPLTVEPLVFFYSLSYGLNEVVSTTIKEIFHKPAQLQVIRASLLTEKICQNKLNFSAEVCANLTQLEDTQHEVQRHVTDYEALFKTSSIVPK